MYNRHPRPEDRRDEFSSSDVTWLAAFGRRAVAVVLATLLVALALVSLFALAAPELVSPARAQERQQDAETRTAGLFFRSAAADKVFEAPLVGSEVEITVNGEIARVSVVQHFHNPSEAWMEGVYVFPLPEDSAVDRLKMIVGDREIDGRIMEREEARQVYEEAVAAGQRASLLTSERANVFTTSVANIGPGETIRIAIEYQEALPYKDGLYSLRFPMVVAPRYTPGEAVTVNVPAPPDGTPQPQPISGGPATVEDGQPRDVFGPVRGPENGLGNPLRLQVELDAGQPLAELASLNHEIAVAERADGSRLVTLADGAVAADRDFVLEWRPAVEGAPEPALFAEQVGDNSYLRISLLPQSDATEVARPERDVIFIVDTSGSMYGPSMAQAKDALLAAVDRLQPGDRFEIVRFSDSTEELFGEVEAFTAESRRAARGFVLGLEANGGTEMFPALAAALKQPADPGRLRQVVFLTDGAVGNEQELFALIDDRLGGSRLFTVGIGSAPNSYFMTKAAEVGRGSFTYIGDLAEVAARMQALFRKLERPALTGVELAWEGPAADRVEVTPALMPDLYAGDPVAITARVSGLGLDQLRGAVTLTGEVEGQPWQRRIALDGLETAPGVAAIWGRAKLDELENGLYWGRDPHTVRDLSVATALEFQLVSRYTSLVAVEEEIARPEDEGLVSGEVPRNLPDGWSHEKVFGTPGAAMPMRELKADQAAAFAQLAGNQVSLPQTATPAQLKALLGAALLILALVLLLLYARAGARRAA